MYQSEANPASSDCRLFHVLSKLFLYRFRAFAESLLCCPPFLFFRAFLVVSLEPLVAAVAATEYCTSPGATSSVTSAPAPRDGVVCAMAASSHLVEQTSGGWPIMPMSGAHPRLVGVSCSSAVVAPLWCSRRPRVSPSWPLSSLVLPIWPPLASALSLPLLLRPLATPTLPLPLLPRPLLPPCALLLSRASPSPLLPSPPALVWVPALPLFLPAAATAAFAVATFAVASAVASAVTSAVASAVAAAVAAAVALTVLRGAR